MTCSRPDQPAPRAPLRMGMIRWPDLGGPVSAGLTNGVRRSGLAPGLRGHTYGEAWYTHRLLSRGPFPRGRYPYSSRDVEFCPCEYLTLEGWRAQHHHESNLTRGDGALSREHCLQQAGRDKKHE